MSEDEIAVGLWMNVQRQQAKASMVVAAGIGLSVNGPESAVALLQEAGVSDKAIQAAAIERWKADRKAT